MKSPTKQPSIYDSICIFTKLYILDIIIQIYQTQKVPQIRESQRGQGFSFFWGGGLLDVLGFFFSLFPMCSPHWVPMRSSSSSQTVPHVSNVFIKVLFPIAPCFYPICFTHIPDGSIGRNWVLNKATSTIDSHGRVENPQYFPSRCSYDFNKKWFETPQFTYFYMGQ